MSVHFLLGASGTGKSTLLTDAVIRHAEEHPDIRHIVLVPEQFTLETQRLFIARHPRHAMLNIEVLSFAQVARRVFREQAASMSDVLSETAKTMLLALAERDAGTDLTVYKNQMGRPSFTAKLGSLFAEWDMNDISPDRLREIAAEEGLTPLLKSKLSELALLFDAFKKRLGPDRMTAEELMPHLMRLLPDAEFGRGACLYLDGFTGFTSVQYRILTEFMRRCPETVAVLTLPEEEGLPRPDRKASRDDLFGMSRESAARLIRCAEEAGQKYDIRYASGGPERPEDLAFLEKHFLRYHGGSYPEKPVHIRIVSSANAAEEARFAAAKILQLVRDGGYRYRDIAVVVGSTERYSPLLEEVFAEADIPYFTDRREALARHPYLRLLEAGLSAAAENMNRDAVLRFVKSPCGPLSREESDIFENYLLAAGIRGGRQFAEAFVRPVKRRHGESEDAYEVRNRETLEQLEGIRQRAVTPLLRLKDALGSRNTVEALVGAVKDFLAEAVSGIVEEDVISAVADLLDNMASVLGGLVMSRREFRDILSSGLSQLTLGRLPASPDQLVIGDVLRSRFGSIRALIFLGLNEGLVPAARSGGGIITDAERSLLEQYEADLGYTEEKALFEERFYLYSLLTKPREALFLSYARSGSDGKAAEPSLVIREAEKLFPQLKEEDWSLIPAADKIYSEKTAARVLASAIHKEDSDWALLYRLLRRDPAAAERLDMMESGALSHFTLRSISPELAAELYGETLAGSITRLERFAGCPYAHFLEYGLKLKEREEMQWEASDHGVFFHKVMEVLLRTVKERKLRIEGLSAEERETLTAQAVKAAADAAADTELTDRIDREYLLERWKKYFRLQLEVMAELGGGTEFTPEAFELRFGGPKLPPLEFTLEGGRKMLLGGTIDRLDICRQEDRVLLRVVDYKTGSTDYDMTRLWHGLQLQLTAYLDAAAALWQKKEPGAAVVPAGMYYAHLTEPWLDKNADDAARRKALQKALGLSGVTLKEAEPLMADVRKRQGGKGVYSEDTMKALCRYAREKMTELGSAIMEGHIEIAPAADRKGDSCAYCRYRGICRFDRKIEGTAYRIIDKDEEEDICARILERAEEGQKDGSQ